MLPHRLPHQIHSHFLVRKKSSSTGQTVALSSTLTLVTPDKRNAQLDLNERYFCWVISWLYPQWPVFLRPLDTACSAKEEDVQSFLSVCLFWDKNLGSSDLLLLWGYVTNGVKSVCEISEILFLCWWAALYVVCMRAAWHEYLVIHFVFES